MTLVYTTVTPQSGDFLGPAKRRLMWASPFLFLFHPAPYLVVGLVTATLLAILGRLSNVWASLLLGFYAYAVFLGLLIVARLLRKRQLHRGAQKT
jgi:hypothetical protein